jgi:hypothetical protein
VQRGRLASLRVRSRDPDGTPERCRLEGRDDPIQVAAALRDVQARQLRSPLLGLCGPAHLDRPSLATAQPDLVAFASDSLPRLVDDFDATIRCCGACSPAATAAASVPRRPR